MNPIAIAIDSVWHHKLRSALTALGVVIGVFAVVSLLALGTSVKTYVTSQFSSFGAQLITITPALAGSGGSGIPRGRQGGGFSAPPPSTFTMGDVGAIRGVAHVARAAGIVAVPTEVTNGTRMLAGTSVVGTSSSLISMQHLTIAHGSFPAPSSHGILLGAKVAATLFPAGGAIGRPVKVGTTTFTVTGVLAASGNLFGSDPDTTAYVSAPTALGLAGTTHVSEIIAEASGTSQVTSAAAGITKLMGVRHPAKDFRIITATQILSVISGTLSTITAVLGGIAGISLLVGGIGIMNIMLVTVAERFREIGIRKAMGARRGDILLQFLLESVVLALIGGGVGVLLAWLAATIAARAIGIPVALTVSSVIEALAFSAVVGAIFGVLPALRAAALTPVEALRTE